jgi:hypothetical protein
VEALPYPTHELPAQEQLAHAAGPAWKSQVEHGLGQQCHLSISFWINLNQIKVEFKILKFVAI